MGCLPSTTLVKTKNKQNKKSVTCVITYSGSFLLISIYIYPVTIGKLYVIGIMLSLHTLKRYMI